MAKHINRKLHNLLNLPNIYNAKNSQEVVTELTNIKMNENTKIITMDIKDLYMNLPTQGIINAIRYWLNKNPATGMTLLKPFIIRHLPWQKRHWNIQ